MQKNKLYNLSNDNKIYSQVDKIIEGFGLIKNIEHYYQELLKKWKHGVMIFLVLI